MTTLDWKTYRTPGLDTELCRAIQDFRILSKNNERKFNEIFGIKPDLDPEHTRYLRIVKALDVGGNPNAVINHGVLIPVIFYAIGRKNETKIIKLLLDRGANVNALTEFGKTVLMTAVDEGTIETVKLLVDRGADVNIKDENGWTAQVFIQRTVVDKSAKEAFFIVNQKN